MLRVFQGRHLPEAHLVCALLQAEGIGAEVRGSELFTAVGLGSSAPGMLPTVWISDPADSARANALIARFNAGERSGPAGTAWACPTCQETHEPQFLSCWKCGTPKPCPAPA
jgi:hypothetical protein